MILAHPCQRLAVSLRVKQELIDVQSLENELHHGTP